jgi:ribonuclease P/MRP protein subunit RPP1
MQRERVAAMKRIFADLHLQLNPKDLVSAARVLTKAAWLGYGFVAIPLSTDTHPKDKEKLAEICKRAEIDMVSRVDLQARTRDQLMNNLRKLRRKYEVICVSCENKEVARQAAKDRRVDLISFPSVDYSRRFLDRSEAELIRSGLAAWEIDTKPLFLLEGPARTRFLSTIRREISIAEDFDVPLVLSSGVSNELLLRKPMEIAAIAGLFGLDETSALDSVSTIPVSIVERNREKLGSGFVAPGIAVIKEGNDY